MAKETLKPEKLPKPPRSSRPLACKILDAFTSHIAVLDRHGVIVAANAAWKRFAKANGCQDSAFYIGTNYLDVCERAIQHGDVTADLALKGIRAVLRGDDDFFALEYPCHSPYQERWFIVRVTRFARRASASIVVEHEEITARKRAEEQARYHARLLANVNDVLVGTDASFNIAFWNPAAEKVFGWRSDEAIGRQVAELLRTEFSDSNRTDSIRTLTEQGIWIGEVTQYAKDGSPLVFEASIMALYDQDGRVAGYVSANRDITERKYSEMALQASEARFRNLTESLPDAVYILDLVNHKVVYFNHDSFLNYSRDDLMADGSILAAIHPEDVPAVMAHWQQLIDGQLPGSLEYRLCSKSGQWEWVASRARIVSRNADQAPTEVMVILTTITERKQAEAALRRAKDTIEVANRELQQVLAREQLMARTDELTQVNNRRYFFDLARHEFAVAQRYSYPLSAILFDIDHFKHINDTFGHQIGDEVLQHIARTAGEHLRAADILARYGGEEFVILLPNSSAQQARVLGERIRNDIGNGDIATSAARVRVTISAGIADILPQADTLERLIQRADQALYAAKSAGRNCVICFPPLGRPLQ